jgi:hypothetical protein
MANFREHVTVSGLLGLGYGAGATLALGFTPVQGLLAGCLTGVGGMLPDLDSPKARPVQELFGVVAAVAPLLLVNRVMQVLQLASDPETVMALIVCMYPLIKYGGALLIDLLSVHRGMFHSIPAMIISGEVVYLAHPNSQVSARLLMAGGVCVGFLSHLLLDELYSVHLKDKRLQLKRSSGTALKLSGDKFAPNVLAYTLLATLTYAVLYDGGYLDQQPARRGAFPLSTGPAQTVEPAPEPELGMPVAEWPPASVQ